MTDTPETPPEAEALLFAFVVAAAVGVMAHLTFVMAEEFRRKDEKERER